MTSVPQVSVKPVSAQHHLDFGAPVFAPHAFIHSTQSARPWATLKTWQNWPGGVFALCGETGAGKSHLANIWAISVDAKCLDGASLDLAVVEKLTDQPAIIALIDNADTADELALFTLLTALERQGGGVLLVSSKPPVSWSFALPDLKSRLAAIAFETMTAPEDDLLASVIVRHAAAAGFRIDAASSQYLAARIPRTFKAARDIVACMESVDRANLKSPKALASRALHLLYTHGDYDDPATTPDLFD